MTGQTLDILQVSWRDREGGAERIALEHGRWLRARGHRATLAVGVRTSDEPHAVTIPNDRDRGIWFRSLDGAARVMETSLPSMSRVIRHAADPLQLLDRARGREPMRFPGTRNLLDLPPSGNVDLLHCHNLHRDYFDLRELPRLSHTVPTVLTLHDAWLLSGHCAHSFACERWRTGCGRCPDLSAYPRIRRDATAFNWNRKRDIYAKSRLYVATPSRWLMEKVEASMLMPGVAGARVIPNGVDLSVFRPGSKEAARAAIGLSQGAQVLLFAGTRVRDNPFKDYGTLRKSLHRLADEKESAPSLICLALGDDGPPERFGRCEVRPVKFEPDPARVAEYYRAADVYVHAARADTFPTTVLEALACGTPVVATSVGGVPEQVRSLRAVEAKPPMCVAAKAFDVSQATGILVLPGDPSAMAEAIGELLSNRALCRYLAENATVEAAGRFDGNKCFGAYLAWYREILAAHDGARPVADARGS